MMQPEESSVEYEAMNGETLAWLSELRSNDHAIGNGWRNSEGQVNVPVLRREFMPGTSLWSGLYQPFATTYARRAADDGVKSYVITGYPRIAGAEYAVSIVESDGSVFAVMFLGASRSFGKFLQPHMDQLYEALQSICDAKEIRRLRSRQRSGYIFLIGDELVFLLAGRPFRDAPEEPVVSRIRQPGCVVDARVIDGVWCFDGWLRLAE